MSNNNRLPKKQKQVRDVKGEVEPGKRQIDIVNGNTAILTVQFLNSINENLIDIRNMLKEAKDG